MAILFCSVAVTLALRGALLVLKQNHSFNSCCPEWNRILLVPALLVSVGLSNSCSVSELKGRLASLLAFTSSTSRSPSLSDPNSPLHPLHSCICCSLFLVFLCNGWKKKKNWRFLKKKKMRRKTSVKSLWENADRHTHGRKKTPQGSVPILYMYNKLRCF